MINNSKEDFLSSVKMRASEFQKKSFELCMEGFVKTVIKKAADVDVPKSASPDDQMKLANVVKTTIDSASSQIVKNAKVNDETSKCFNVDLASEITDPKTISESFGSKIANCTKEESKDRECTLESLWDSGYFKNQNYEEVDKYIQQTFENLMFDTKFDNGARCAKGIQQIYSIEGESLIESIKSDVTEMVKETEAKNDLIREAVGEINKTKETIETEINGDDSRFDAIAEKNESDDNGGEDNTNESIDDIPDTDDTPSEDDSEDQSGENLKQSETVIVAPKKVSFSKEDFIFGIDSNGDNSAQSSESFNFFEKNDFSKESAEEILSEFRQLDNGIDTNEIAEKNDKTFSTSEDEGGEDTDVSSGDDNAESNESNDDDDDNDYDTNEIDGSSFASKETIDGIKPEEISEESLARELCPLSIRKMGSRDVVINRKNIAALLACKADRGEEFFKQTVNRVSQFSQLMSQESIAEEDPLSDKIKSVMDNSNKIKADVEVLKDNLGILGLLDNKYQRTDDKTENAVKSLVKPGILSKESLEEHKFAEIFKMTINLSELNSKIAKGVDVAGNRAQMGYIEELLNEKMFEIDDVYKADVELKVKALQSIESVCPFQDIVNMQVFVSESEGTPKPSKIALESLKGIDAYGYSYIDEIIKIKNTLTAKYKKESNNGDYNAVNVDISTLVDYLVDNIDTTALDPTLYEKVITKLVSNKTIESSTEAWLIRSKAKIVTTAFTAGDKLGYLSTEDIAQIEQDLL